MNGSERMPEVSPAEELHQSSSGIYWEGPPRVGWALIVPGHGHAHGDLLGVAQREWSLDRIETVETSEEWLAFHKRIKWCDRLTGFGCDMAGDWHGHWEPVRANPAAPDAMWTLICPVYAMAGSAS